MCNCAEYRQDLRDALLQAKLAEAARIAAKGLAEIVKGVKRG